jgi:hypothetical protein
MHLAYKIVVVTVMSCVASIAYGVLNGVIATGMALKIFTHRKCQPDVYNRLLNSPFVDKSKFTEDNPAPDLSTLVPRWKVVFFFGVLWTWWVGVLFGLVLCIPAFVGKWPHIPLTTVLVGIGVLVPINFIISVVAAYVIDGVAQIGDRTGSQYSTLLNNCGPKGYIVVVMNNAGYIMSVVSTLLLSVFIIVRRHRQWTHRHV